MWIEDTYPTKEIIRGVEFRDKGILRYDGGAIIDLRARVQKDWKGDVRISKPIIVLFEARGRGLYDFDHYRDVTTRGTGSSRGWDNYRLNAQLKNKFASDNKIVLISLDSVGAYLYKLEQAGKPRPSDAQLKDDYRAHVRQELIKQFKSQTKLYEYSYSGIELNPRSFNEEVFRRGFLISSQLKIYKYF